MTPIRHKTLPDGKIQFQEIPVPAFPKKINLGAQEDYCNLSCPKCLVFGTNKDPNFDIVKFATSAMSTEQVVQILDEVQEHKPIISPAYWVEPLVIKNIKEIIVEAKKRDLPIDIGTNGLLINAKMAEFLVEHVAVINVSIDATTCETLKKARSTTRLKRIHDAVFLLLEKRGSNNSPRIVVNFTAEECNRHEQQEFLDYWLQHVDAVRINEMYTYERHIDNLVVSRNRTPCREIYDQMSIDFNGDVRMCCVDGFRKTNLGNVFKESVYDVWHGAAFTAVRKSHEDGAYDTQQFCGSCTLWASYNITDEREENNLLIRSSDSVTYYNRMDKISSWKKEIVRNDLEFLSS